MIRRIQVTGNFGILAQAIEDYSRKQVENAWQK